MKNGIELHGTVPQHLLVQVLKNCIMGNVVSGVFGAKLRDLKYQNLHKNITQCYIHNVIYLPCTRKHNKPQGKNVMLSYSGCVSD